MDLGLHGKVALVAAASRGLGFAVAEELAREGMKLVICAGGEPALRTAAQSLRALGTQVIDVVADLSRADDVARVIERAIGEHGGVDVLVTNAGGPPAGPFEAHSAEAWHAAARGDLATAVELVRGVLPGMKERRWGRIINVTSIAVKQPVHTLILPNTTPPPATAFAPTLPNA